MKYNLANFPKIPDKMRSERDAEKWLEQLDEWLDGFEKELRETVDSLVSEVAVQRAELELIKEQYEFEGSQREEAIFDSGYCKGVYEKIKEILGDV